MSEYWQLFIIFARIGGLTFGGGYAMLPLLQKEVVDNKKWVTEQELLDYYAVGQCTPGVIAVNTATFIGYKIKGVLGAISATIGVIFPSLVIIMFIAAFLKNFTSIPMVHHAFEGIRIVVGVLIVNAIIKLWKQSVVDYKGIIIVISVFVFGEFIGISSIYIVIAAAIIGLINKTLTDKREAKS